MALVFILSHLILRGLQRAYRVTNDRILPSMSNPHLQRQQCEVSSNFVMLIVKKLQKTDK
jgi:hypothetical protein